MNFVLPDPCASEFLPAFQQCVQGVVAQSLPDITIRQYLRAIFRTAVQYNHQHALSFLLFQVPWFAHGFVQFHDLLHKLLRWYHNKGKECTTVCFTLLAEGYVMAEDLAAPVHCTVKLLEGRYDHQTFLNTLKESFPHKNRPLEHHLRFVEALLQICEKKPCLRSAILEIIVQKLSTFDTEIKNGDQMIGHPFVEDSPPATSILNSNPNNNNNNGYSCHSDLQTKLDRLLMVLLKYIEGHGQVVEVTEQLLLIFHKKILLMDQNKYIQYIMFYASESSPRVSGYFLSILLNTLIEHNQVNYSNCYINNVFYMGSYLVRSKISHKRLKNCLKQTIHYAKKLVQLKPELTLNGLLLNEILQENQHFLYIYQMVLYVFAHKPELFKELSSEFHPLLQSANKKCCADILVNSEILHRFNKNCRGSSEEYSRPETEFLHFENKFNPIRLQMLSEKMEPYFSRYGHQGVEPHECNKRKRGYVVENRIQKKLKMISEEHISDTSTQMHLTC